MSFRKATDVGHQPCPNTTLVRFNHLELKMLVFVSRLVLGFCPSRFVHVLEGKAETVVLVGGRFSAQYGDDGPARGNGFNKSLTGI